MLSLILSSSSVSSSSCCSSDDCPYLFAATILPSSSCSDVTFICKNRNNYISHNFSDQMRNISNIIKGRDTNVQFEPISYHWSLSTPHENSRKPLIFSCFLGVQKQACVIKRVDYKHQSCHHIETSNLICSANQLIGFYMMATLVFNELNLKQNFQIIPYVKKNKTFQTISKIVKISSHDIGSFSFIQQF